jgi:hypothetical protein
MPRADPVPDPSPAPEGRSPGIRTSPARPYSHTRGPRSGWSRRPPGRCAGSADQSGSRSWSAGQGGDDVAPVHPCSGGRIPILDAEDSRRRRVDLLPGLDRGLRLPGRRPARRGAGCCAGTRRYPACGPPCSPDALRKLGCMDEGLGRGRIGSPCCAQPRDGVYDACAASRTRRLALPTPQGAVRCQRSATGRPFARRATSPAAAGARGRGRPPPRCARRRPRGRARGRAPRVPVAPRIPTSPLSAGQEQFRQQAEDGQ